MKGLNVRVATDPDDAAQGRYCQIRNAGLRSKVLVWVARGVPF